MGSNTNSPLFTRPITKLKNLSPRFNTVPCRSRIETTNTNLTKFSFQHISTNLRTSFIRTLPKLHAKSMNSSLDRNSTNFAPNSLQLNTNDISNSDITQIFQFESVSQIESSDSELNQTCSTFKPENFDSSLKESIFDHTAATHIDPESLNQFLKSRFTDALTCPFLVQLSINYTGKLSMETIQLDRLSAHWNPIGNGLLVFIFHKNPKLPRHFDSIELCLCELVTFRVLFRGLIALPNHPICEPDQLHQQICAQLDLVWKIRKDRNNNVHFFMLDYSRSSGNNSTFPNQKHCSEKLTSSSLQKSDRKFDFKEYAVCKIEYNEQPDLELITHFYKILEERFVQILEQRMQPESKRKEAIQAYRRLELERTKLFKNSKQRALFKTSISSPCMFIHVTAVQKQDLKRIEVNSK